MTDPLHRLDAYISDPELYYPPSMEELIAARNEIRAARERMTPQAETIQSLAHKVAEAVRHNNLGEAKRISKIADDLEILFPSSAQEVKQRYPISQLSERK